MSQHNQNNGGYKFSFITLALLILFLFAWGCKDTEQADSSSELEQCKIYMDKKEWSDAISTCKSAGGDEGYHLAALAHMAASGLTIIDLAQSLLDSSSGSGTAGVIFDYIPDTTSDRINFQTALSYLMGSSINGYIIDYIRIGSGQCCSIIRGIMIATNIGVEATAKPAEYQGTSYIRSDIKGEPTSISIGGGIQGTSCELAIGFG